MIKMQSMQPGKAIPMNRQQMHQLYVDHLMKMAQIQAGIHPEQKYMYAEYMYKPSPKVTRKEAIDIPIEVHKTYIGLQCENGGKTTHCLQGWINKKMNDSPYVMYETPQEGALSSWPSLTDFSNDSLRVKDFAKMGNYKRAEEVLSSYKSAGINFIITDKRPSLWERINNLFGVPQFCGVAQR